MNTNQKFQGIISLSAASIALSQSMFAKDSPMDPSLVETTRSLDTRNASNTANLILAPVHREDAARLYADHASHASHASHYSGSDSYSVPDAPAPSNPGYTLPTPQPVTPVTNTNATSQTALSTGLNQTKSLQSTNVPTSSVSTNDAEFIDFLKKRAAAGSADAQFSLAICYLHGSNGVKKDTETAKLLLEMSADQGNAEAKTKLEELKEAVKNSNEGGK